MSKRNVSMRLRKDADSIWRRIFDHRFIIEIYRGDLPMDKFRFYVLQDYKYLIEDIKNLSILASKSVSVETAKEILEIAHLEAVSELRSYETLLRKLGYVGEGIVKLETAPITTSYTSFLLATSSLGTFWEGLAATLPCFWTYIEIYDQHKDKLKGNTNKLYVEWASVYSTETYSNLVDRMRSLMDKADGNYERLRRAFITSSRYEYMYWDMVYGKLDWTV